MTPPPDPLGARTRSFFLPYQFAKGDEIISVGSAAATRVISTSIAWHDLAASLTQHSVQPDKAQAPCWSPAEYRAPDAKRTAKAVLQLHDLVLDLDYGTPETQLQTIQRVVDLGVTFCVYSSHSHTDEKPRLRVVVPMATPVPGPLWKPFYKAVLRDLDPSKTLDAKACNPDRVWYAPTVATANAPRVAYYRPTGHPFDPSPYVEKVLARPTARAQSFEAFREAHTADTKALLSHWKRSRHQHYGTLEALLRGAPYAISGTVDNVTYQLTRDMVRDAGHLTTTSLVDLFRPSVGLMDPQGAAEYLEKIGDMIERAREDLSSESTVSDRDVDLLSTMFGAPDAAPLTTPEPARGTALLVHADDTGALYLYQAGTYVGPVALQDRMATIVRVLRPYIASGQVSLHTAQGNPLPVDALILRYGRTVNDVAYEIGLTTPRIDLDSGRTTLVLGTANRVGAPAPSIVVAQFLRSLCATDREHDDLLTWLVVAKTRPFDSLPALALIGKLNTGKTLFAHSVSTLWHTQGPIKAREALSNHAEGLLRCPLVFADEQLPADDRTGKIASAAFREAIGDKSYRVNPKFRSPVTVHGAQRWIIAVNALSKLEWREDLGPDEITAVCDRIYPLNMLGREMPILPPHVAKQIHAEFFGHVLHLCATHAIPEHAPHRFWVRPERSDLEAYYRTEGPALRGHILYWICSLLRRPSDLRMALPPGRAPDSTLAPLDALAVSVRDIVDSWQMLGGGSRRPTPTEVARQLAVLQRGNSELDPSGAVPIDVEHVVSWAIRHRVAREADLRRPASEGAQIIPFPRPLRALP